MPAFTRAASAIFASTARSSAFPFLLTACLTSSSGALDIPKENARKGELPPIATAEAGARRLVDAIAADRPEDVLDFFFPSEPFDALKAIAKPGDYHKQLVAWYVTDVHKAHAKLKGSTKLTFDGFQRGACKWKEAGTEANKIPYWSCYRNKIYARTDAGERIELELRVMINWGDSWYVTHLGKPP